MRRPALIPSEEKNNPILIVDKFGVLGELIAQELSKELLVILVSGEKLKEEPENIIHIPYSKKFPVIPDNTYSHIIIFDEKDMGIEESLPIFIKKGSKDQSILVYSSSLSNRSQKLASKIIDSYKNAKAIIYGDIFGEEKALVFDNSLNLIFRQVIKNNKIRIPGDGLTNVYPILLKDTVSGILKAIFGESKSKIFFLFPKHPLSLITLSHILQKKDPTITIDFVKEKEEEEKTISIEGEYLVLEGYKPEGKIKETDFKDWKTEIDAPKRKEKGEEKIDLKRFLYPILLFIFILILPALFTFGFMMLSVFNGGLVKKSIESGNISQTASSLKSINYLLEISLYSGKILKEEVGFFGLGKSIENLNYKIESYKKLSYAGYDMANSLLEAEKIFKGTSEDPQKDLLYFSSSFKNSLNLIEEVRISSDEDRDLYGKIRSYDRIINMLGGLHDSFFSLVNPKEKKTYLVLFQNNMELRPGGGFIGSYGILSLDKGKISDFSIHDVYDADGQLKGHIEPPYPVRRYLPSAHLYLRDSNFDVDFTKSASSAAFLLYEEVGQKVDGVIGVDVFFVKELVGSLGQVYVPEYRERVDKNNFYQITQSHSEKNFFPSSTQKKDFLNALFSALKLNLTQRKNLPYFEILKAGIISISEKHILFAFSDKNLQSTFVAKNWSGSLLDFRKDIEVEDFLGINEANFGVNKANFFVGRSLKYQVLIKDDGSIISSANLNLINNSTDWPGGDYKTYIRLIAPLGSTLISISIDGVERKIRSAVTDPLIYEKKGFKPPEELEVENYNQDGKTIFGFLTIVPTGKSKSIIFNYALAQKVPVKNPSSSYSLKLFKQPGTENYPFDFVLSFPQFLTVSSKDIKLNNSGKVVLSKIFSTDETINFDLSRL